MRVLRQVGMFPGTSETAWFVSLVITSAAPGYSPTGWMDIVRYIDPC